MNPSVGFTAGAWDLLHAGHVMFLQECMGRCDNLVVGLHTNPSIDRSWKNSPVQTTFERFVQLKGFLKSPYIIPYDTERDLMNILSSQGITKRFLGSDYEGQDFTGKDLCEGLGIELVYIPRMHDYSTSELRQRIERVVVL